LPTQDIAVTSQCRFPLTEILQGVAQPKPTGGIVRIEPQRLPKQRFGLLNPTLLGELVG
jgi:hypothetical protein